MIYASYALQPLNCNRWTRSGMAASVRLINAINHIKSDDLVKHFSFWNVALAPEAPPKKWTRWAIPAKWSKLPPATP